MGSKLKKANKPTSNNLEDRLNKYSFKIKPILLEFQNYNYFHTALSSKTGEGQERFLGRRKVLNKILSFVQETSSNTGTYLVTGYRGMGKTSVVNMALSFLNSNKSSGNYIKYWFLLLPIVIFWNSFKPFSKYLFEFDTKFFVTLFILFFLASIVTILELGYQEGRNNRINKSWGKKLINTFSNGFRNLYNPKFQKSKLNFQKSLRFFFILFWGYFLTLFSLFIYKDQDIQRHGVFWFISIGLFVVYLISNSYEELIWNRKFKNILKGGTKKNDVKWTKRIGLLSTHIILLAYVPLYFNCGIIFNGIYLFLILCIFVGAKFVLKRRRLQKNSNKYETTLSGARALLDFQKYLVVKINLGKDNLSEKDVLKYITNEIAKVYKSWFYNLKSIHRFLYTFAIFFIPYFFLTAFYSGFLGSRFTEFTESTLKLSTYFPSQTLLSIDSLKTEDVNWILTNHYGKDANLEEYLYNITWIKFSGNAAEDERAHVNGTINELNQRRQQYIGLNNAANYAQIGYVPLDLDKKKGEVGFWKSTFQKVANEIDYLTLKLWYNIRLILIDDVFKEENYVNNVVNKLYPRVPVLAIYIFLLFLLMALWLLPKRFSFIKGHVSTIKKIQDLEKEIDASITFEQNGQASTLNTSWFSFKKALNYQPLGAKDISQRLIHILDEIDELPFFFINVKFIIVLDELDKISPHDNSVLSAKEDEYVKNNDNEVRYQTSRKERIALILSSMKHFLNSAKAKFILIAGREMYDAALAGISDRESSLESIFNDNKIYVNSFYTENEDDNLSDITSITEQYLCQFLLPESYLTSNANRPSLFLYGQYLEEYFKGTDDDVAIRKQKIDKIIITLKDFIVYLTYRSNGAPRKLSNLLEKYLVPLKEKDIANDTILYVGKTDENLYLEIGYYNQYKVSLISYLTSPIFLGLGNYMHEYSDKLLVSISYMLDHLYKFHKLGISYRSLSLIPEIVDINKEPQFRVFLDKLVNTLSRNHLTPILSGIYDFKFNRKVSEEIKFLSKIDEFEGAAFNFTLDESIELKRFFNRRLEQMKSVNSQLVINNLSDVYEDHVHSTSLLNVMIGDLHYYDEEYHEAINHYLDAIQTLRQKNIKDMNLYDFILFVRNKLKLGMAFEKNKMYDNALMTYSELTDLIIRKRDLPLKRFGLVKFVVNRKDLEVKSDGTNSSAHNYEISNFSEFKKSCEKRFKKIKNIEIVVFGRLNAEAQSASAKDEENNELKSWEKVYPVSCMETFYASSPKKVFQNLTKSDINQDYLKQYFLQSTGENVRLLYQPILAKLHLIEKTGPDKLKDCDIIRAINEFNFLKMPLNTKSKKVLVSEFYNKLGDLLYFKNGTLNEPLKCSIIKELENTDDVSLRILLTSPIDALICYIKSLAILLIPRSENTDMERIDRIVIEEFYPKIDSDSDSSEKILEKNSKFLKNLIEENFLRIGVRLESMVDREKLKSEFSNEYLNSIANGVTDLAEAFLSFSCLSRHEIVNEKLTSFNLLGIEKKIILKLYNYARIIYEKTGEYRLAKSQFLKIFYMVKDYPVIDFEEDFPLNSLDKMKNKCIELAYNSYDQSYHVEIDKIVDLFLDSGAKKDLDLSKDSSFESNSIAMNEIGEIICLEQIVRFKNALKDRNANGDKIIDFYKFVYNYINPFSKTHRRQNRLLELHARLMANKSIFMDVWSLSKIKELAELINHENSVFQSISDAGCANKCAILQLHEFLVLDSIGACNELIKTYNLLDMNYTNIYYLALARTHKIMAFWCSKYEKIKKAEKTENEDNDLEKVLKRNILNSKTLVYVNEIYHLKMAEQLNQKANNFHQRGEPLNSFLRPVSYLDDFFNDNYIHFLMAMERDELHELELDDNPLRELRVRINDLDARFCLPINE